MRLQTPPLPAPALPAPPLYRRLVLSVAVLALAGVMIWYAVCWIVWTRQFQAAALPLRTRDYVAAEEHLAWCRWAWPSDPETWLISARNARRSGDRKQSQAWLEQAERAGASVKEVRLERLLDYAQWEFSPDVEETLREQLKLSRSDYPLIAEALTAEFMRVYRLSEAREILDRWIELDPDDTEPYVRRAWVAEHQLDFDAAVMDYRRVLEAEPDRWQIRLRIADILFKLRKPAEAVPELERVKQQQPEDAVVAITLSKCYRELGKHSQAEDALNDLSKSIQAEARVRAERGLIALAQGDYAKAESLLRDALQDLPREREILYGLQQCLSQSGKIAEAEEVQRVLKEVDVDGRRMGEVITGLTRDPSNADLRFEGANIFLRNGIQEDGIRWLHMTLDANPRHVAAHERLAEEYEKAGKPDLAAIHEDIVRKLQKPASP